MFDLIRFNAEKQKLLNNANSATPKANVPSIQFYDYSFFPIILSCPGDMRNDECFINRSLRYAAVTISQWCILNNIPVNSRFTLTGFTNCDNFRFEARVILNNRPLSIIAYCENGLMNIVSRYIKASDFKGE